MRLTRAGPTDQHHVLRGFDECRLLQFAYQCLVNVGGTEVETRQVAMHGKPGTAPLTSSWFSPHEALVFPNLAIVTYHGAGVRAIDVSNPFIMRELGYFINAPVQTVRWASWGITGEFVPFGAAPGQVRMRPTVGPPMVVAFSYVLSRNGYLIYADINSGLYILKYTGSRNEEIPQVGVCLTGNPGAIAPGYEPCPPYGKWDSPANAWTKTGIATP